MRPSYTTNQCIDAQSSESFDDQFAIEQSTNYYEGNVQWTSPFSAQYQPQALPYNPSPFNFVHISQDPGAWYANQVQQACVSGSGLISGLFDERVHHKYRNQVNFEKWFEEDPDWLLGCVCPADLCDIPCQWDEIGGCQMFRLCKIRQKYPHPIHGPRPPCDNRTMHLCDGIHDIIEPSCRSLGKQITDADSKDWQFCSYQTCGHVAALIRGSHTHVVARCRWGHDYEAARVVAIWMYWVHTALACRLGARGMVQRRDDVYAWEPVKPDIRTLHDVRVLDNGTVQGFTFHDHEVLLPWDVYHYFLDRHERRARSLGYHTVETQSVETSKSVCEEEPEAWSSCLRKAASWSNLIGSIEPRPGARRRSDSSSM